MCICFQLCQMGRCTPASEDLTSVCRRHMYAKYLPVSRPLNFWLAHPDSFKSAHDLKCMCIQTAPLFNVPRRRRGAILVSNTPISTPAHTRVRDRTGSVAWKAVVLIITPLTQLFAYHIESILVIKKHDNK